MARPLDLIDEFVAHGKQEFSFAEARGALGISTEATANALRRLRTMGVVDRVARGHYAIRPLGSLGTSAAANDIASAVAAAFDGLQHRIAYQSALAELGLLTRPVRTVFVACTRQVRVKSVSRRRLRVVIEDAGTIHLDAVRVGSSWRSSLERALLECARRMDLAGGVETLAEALAGSAHEADPRDLERLAEAFGARGSTAVRRLASLGQALDLPLALEPAVAPRQSLVRMVPRDDRTAWVDEKFRVIWNISIDELLATVRN